MNGPASRVVPRFKQALKAWLAGRNFNVRRYPGELVRNREWVLRPDFEFVVAHYLGNRDPNAEFHFIQIGAFDGVSGDPIHEFVRKFGWKGILVEPQRVIFERLRQNYSDCEGLTFVNAAVSDTPSEKILYTLPPEGEGLPDWAAQISSFSLENVLKHRSHIHDLESKVVQETVRCVTIEELISRLNGKPLDLLQIDVEGYDAEVLGMIEFGRVRPAIVRFEHRHLPWEAWNSSIRLLARHGYRILVEATDTTAYRRDARPGPHSASSSR